MCTYVSYDGVPLGAQIRRKTELVKLPVLGKLVELLRPQVLNSRRDVQGRGRIETCLQAASSTDPAVTGAQASSRWFPWLLGIKSKRGDLL